jgi:hypothetical protein
MSLKPTRYEYIPPVVVAGIARDFTSKVEISQHGGQWMAVCHVTSVPLGSSGEALTKLREELLRLIEYINAGLK